MAWQGASFGSSGRHTIYATRATTSMLSTESKGTLPFGIRTLVSTYDEVRGDEMMVVAMLQVLLVVIAFVWLQSRFVLGLSAGAARR